MTPKKINRYEIIERIGAGGTGEVFLARDPRMDSRVAVKVLHQHLCGDSNMVERFRCEPLRIRDMPKTENIVTIYDTGEYEGRPYFVMEFLEGKPLQKMLEKDELTQPQRMEIFRQILKAVEEAHSVGVVHRDLKPDNVMVIPRGKGFLAVVLDFGIAKTGTRLSMTGDMQLLGTPYYMAPEQCMTPEERAEEGLAIDVRTDIYALGVLLYELLAGKPPFTGDNPLTILRAQLEKEPPPIETIIPDTTDAQRDVLTKCLAKNPDARFLDLEELSESFSLAYLERRPDRETLAQTRELETAGAGKSKKPATAAFRYVLALPLIALIIVLARPEWFGIKSPGAGKKAGPKKQTAQKKDIADEKPENENGLTDESAVVDTDSETESEEAAVESDIPKPEKDIDNPKHDRDDDSWFAGMTDIAAGKDPEEKSRQTSKEKQKEKITDSTDQKDDTRAGKQDDSTKTESRAEVKNKDDEPITKEKKEEPKPAAATPEPAKPAAPQPSTADILAQRERAARASGSANSFLQLADAYIQAGNYGKAQACVYEAYRLAGGNMSPSTARLIAGYFRKVGLGGQADKVLQAHGQ